MTSLENELRRIPEPTPPDRLGAAISARIALLDQAPSAEVSEAVGAREAAASSGRLPLLLTAFGIAVGIGAEAYRLVAGWTGRDLVAPWIAGARPDLLHTLPATPAVAVLVAGLLLYLAGLFAPLGAGERG